MITAAAMMKMPAVQCSSNIFSFCHLARREVGRMEELSFIRGGADVVGDVTAWDSVGATADVPHAVGFIADDLQRSYENMARTRPSAKFRAVY